MRSPPRLTIALTVSLALNLFLAGALFGGWLSRDAGGAQPAMAVVEPDYSVAEFIRALPPAARAETEREMADRRTEVRDRIAALRAAREAVMAALTRQPFDAASVDRSFAELRRRSRDLQAALHRMVGEVTGRLSPADRAHLARGMFLFARLPGDDRLALYELPLM